MNKPSGIVVNVTVSNVNELEVLCSKAATLSHQLRETIDELHRFKIEMDYELISADKTTYKEGTE